MPDSTLWYYLHHNSQGGVYECLVSSPDEKNILVGTSKGLATLISVDNSFKVLLEEIGMAKLNKNRQSLGGRTMERLPQYFGQLFSALLWEQYIRMVMASSHLA